MIPDGELTGRQAVARRSMAAVGADAMLLVCRDTIGWQDLFYYTGFIGSAGAFLLTADDSVLIVDPRYADESASIKSCRVELCTETRRQSPFASALEILRRKRSTRVAYAGTSFPNPAGSVISSALGEGVESVDISARIFAQRRKKSRTELAMIKRAADIAAISFEEALGEVRPRMTERAFASFLTYRIHAHGGDFFDDVPIVTASGERGSSPHARPSDRQFREGDLVFVDFSARYHGYLCDITRTFSIGEPSPHVASVWSVLAWAQSEAASRLRAGAHAHDIDAAARGVLVAAELGRYFTHGTGHGVGISIHEPPSISSVSDYLLAEGDVVTIEPGIYRAGEFGMRIEDDYLITADGSVCLTDSISRELRALKR